MAPITSFVKIKPPFQKTNFTSEQFEEFLKCSQDPLYFMANYIYIQHPQKGRMPFVAYPFQTELIKTYWKQTNTIAMIPRQSGKCVSCNTDIRIKHSKTGKQYNLPVEVYYDFIAAMKSGLDPVDISQYEITTP